MKREFSPKAKKVHLYPAASHLLSSMSDKHMVKTSSVLVDEIRGESSDCFKLIEKKQQLRFGVQ